MVELQEHRKSLIEKHEAHKARTEIREWIELALSATGFMLALYLILTNKNPPASLFG